MNQTWPYFGRRLSPKADMMGPLSADFNFEYVPHYRNVRAFEFLRQELNEVAREHGKAHGRLARDVLVERAAAAGIDRHDAEVAISVYLLADYFDERDGTIGHTPQKQGGFWILPNAQIAQHPGGRHVFERPQLARTHAIVEDIIRRRVDGRPQSAEPINAFEGLLTQLGHDRFRAWWVQQRTELRLADSSKQPTMQLVTAASLAEAALSFVVPRAQKHGLMKHVDATKPKTWKFAELVKGARSSDPSVEAILDDPTAKRALQLNETRQRIHAGYLIDTVPKGPIPDLKPEQARDGLQTVELVLRKILDWLPKHP